MNIKPFRDYSEHDVVNLYAYTLASGDKGTVVKPIAFNPDNQHTYNGPVGASYDGTWSQRYGSNNRVGPAASGDAGILGILLYDVRETDENGEKLIFKGADKKAAMNAVCSGEVVPVLTKGMVYVNGHLGEAAPGSGAAANANGGIRVTYASYNGTDRIGKWLSPSGIDGYALLKLEL